MGQQRRLVVIVVVVLEYHALMLASLSAWQQHDVQELMRVMLDALERKWKNTPQADLINKLYQGTPTSYS